MTDESTETVLGLIDDHTFEVPSFASSRTFEVFSVPEFTSLPQAPAFDYASVVKNLEDQVADLQKRIAEAETDRDHYRVQMNAARNEATSLKSQLTQRSRTRNG